MNDAIRQYHEALALSFKVLGQDPSRSGELLTESVKSLDQRIAAMRKLVVEVTSRCAGDQDREHLPT
jgi:hypothetical protein